ncbi:hypothetical protein JAAARDRAFT_169417 [Jaapia argillacea MUCL 33604]|uniref:RNA helicase n=1 Tax=Jaapia argillacea MUCL 33604 TaxID=933084 RepID=A0A067QJ35_9AGAM|nr:hypothetical protein JAAARDRAFT_169417 [Jaapia argillacea MUCL 33604]
MQFLIRTSSPTLRSPCRWAHKPWYCQVRCLSDQVQETRRPPSNQPASHYTFEQLGVHQPLIAALQTAFPNVRCPTQIQTEFMSAVLSGRDVLLNDGTGTGKSFGLTLALLNLPRVRNLDSKKYQQMGNHCMTSLFLVPHRDLACQIFYWIKSISAAASTPDDLFPEVAQLLIRGTSTSLEEKISLLRSTPPHILIGTPQAVMEAYDVDKTALQLDSLSSVAVDEVDYLIEAPPRYATLYAQQKYQKRVKRHPGPTRQLLDIIYRGRVGLHGSEGGKHRNAAEYPQLIMSSATFRVNLKSLVLESGWVTAEEGKLVRVSGLPPSSHRRVRAGSQTSKLLHCAIVVSKDGQIRNIDGAVEPGSNPESSHVEMTSGKVPDETSLRIDDDDGSFNPQIDDMLLKKLITTPSQFEPAALEAIAATFALDVPQLALLVLPATAPVHRAVLELRELGVNAHGLDLLAGDKGRAHLLNDKPDTLLDNPVLLVSTLATTRGIDLPELTHVFVLGIPEGRRVDAYLHMAGRSGRFGRDGKVISVLMEREEFAREDGKIGVRDEPKRLSSMFKEMDITPTRLEHFE